MGNELIVNIKDSSVLNVISVSELFFQAKSAAGTYYRYFEVYFIIAVIYLILTLSVSAILRAVEKKMDGRITTSFTARRATAARISRYPSKTKRRPSRDGTCD